MAHDTTAADALVLDAKAQTQAVIGDIRRLVYNLRPPMLDDLGLVAALREFVGHYHGMSGLQITVDTPELLPPLSAAVEVAVHRIALEAVNNVFRHAKARTCCVGLALSDAFCLDITDDGCGLPDNGRAGVGLNSMRERDAELGGSCVVEGANPTGTRVRVCLPLHRTN